MSSQRLRRGGRISYDTTSGDDGAEMMNNGGAGGTKTNVHQMVWT